jgi:hypothetical protein
MIRRLLFIVGFAAVMAGCNGGSASPPPFHTGVFVPTPTPSPTPVPQHLYVGNDNTPGTIQQYTIPITGTSTPNFSIASNNVVTVALDAAGNLAAGDNAGHLQFFTAPLSGTSTPAAAFNNGTASNNGQNVFTTAGDMFDSTAGNRVNFFTHPFTNATTPSSSITSPLLTGAIGTGLDAAQNLYIANAGAGSVSNLYVYAPPYTGTPIITPGVASTAYRKLALSATQLFVCSVFGATGRVDVYTLPITATSAPAFAITTGMNVPEGIALDAAGNLYVGNLSDATVRVYAPPFSATSAPTVALTVGPAPFAIFGIAIGK